MECRKKISVADKYSFFLNRIENLKRWKFRCWFWRRENCNLNQLVPSYVFSIIFIFPNWSLTSTLHSQFQMFTLAIIFRVDATIPCYFTGQLSEDIQCFSNLTSKLLRITTTEIKRKNVLKHIHIIDVRH